MERTLFRSDIIIVKKYQLQKINRNDIILFRSNWNKKEYLVKRCIGLPGDTIFILNDTVFCNNKPLPFLPTLQWSFFFPENIEFKKIEKIVNRSIDTITEKKSFKKVIFLTESEKENLQTYLSINLVKVTLPKSNHHNNFHLQRNKNNRCNNLFIVVPSNKYFMMGDNRHASQDSRYWGFVPINRIIGRKVKIFKIYRL